MANSTDKPEIRDPAFQVQEELTALDPNTGLGPLLDEKTLDAISAGDDATLTDRDPDYNCRISTGSVGRISGMHTETKTPLRILMM
jgi:hypothetical protein